MKIDNRCMLMHQLVEQKTNQYFTSQFLKLL
jgi:hypothetical protein